MSNLKVTNIQSNGTGFNDVVSFQNASGTENGTLCRAWVGFNGTGTVAIRAAFNVSSITDDGTGLYTVNMTTALPDTNFCVVATTGSTSTSSGTANTSIQDTSALTARTTSSVQFRLNNSNGNNVDHEYNSVAIFR